MPTQRLTGPSGSAVFDVSSVDLPFSGDGTTTITVTTDLERVDSAVVVTDDATENYAVDTTVGNKNEFQVEAETGGSDVTGQYMAVQE
jgi:hypothetical protein